MTEIPQNVPDIAPPVSQASQTALLVADAALDDDPSKIVRVGGKPRKLRKIAWRITAAVYWVWLILQLLLGSELMNRLSSTAIFRFGSFLSAVGFAPVHSEYLPRTLQIGWLLAVVGFKPFELIWLIIYVYAAPLTLVGYLIFKDYAEDFEQKATFKIGLRQPKVRLPALTIVISRSHYRSISPVTSGS